MSSQEAGRFGVRERVRLGWLDVKAKIISPSEAEVVEAACLKAGRIQQILQKGDRRKLGVESVYHRQEMLGDDSIKDAAKLTFDFSRPGEETRLAKWIPRLWYARRLYPLDQKAVRDLEVQINDEASKKKGSDEQI